MMLALTIDASATDWANVAWASVLAIVALIIVYLWLRRMIEGVATDEAPRDTIPDIEYAVRFDVDPLAPEPFVDAQPTLLPLEDAELIRCRVCHAPLSSLSVSSCWNCSTPNDRSAA